MKINNDTKSENLNRATHYKNGTDKTNKTGVNRRKKGGGKATKVSSPFTLLCDFSSLSLYDISYAGTNTDVYSLKVLSEL